MTDIDKAPAVARSPTSRRAVVRAALLGMATSSTAGLAAAEPVGRFTSRSAGPGFVDHGVFDSLLAQYARPSADGIVRLDYARWKRSGPDRGRLQAYIEGLGSGDPLRLTRAEQFAYWANLYNALTLRVVLEAYPVRSIREIRPSLLALGPWKQKLLRVAGVDLSLDDIEQGILRAGWRDPRVHYAVNCASTSCPNLPLRAWRGLDVFMRLDGAGRAYVNHPRGVHFEGDRLIVSSIFKWYASDFGGADPKVIAYLASLAATPLKLRIEATSKISGDTYDWSLNEARS